MYLNICGLLLLIEFRSGTTGEGYKYIRVMLCQRREPVVGDKFSFMHGQKGTVGIKSRSIDMPFNSQGIAPDIIMNALALPSRMTIAMLIEMWSGKVILSTSPLHKIKLGTEVLNMKDDDECGNDVDADVKNADAKFKSETGQKFKDQFYHPDAPGVIDATPYKKGFDKKIIAEEMRKYGFEYGDEYMTDGVTGKRLRCFAFFGPAFSQRLKHFVIDKMHSRAKGPRTTLTRQPLEGRALGGGLRFGVMERDCTLGQGASRLVRDRLYVCSDAYNFPVCRICGVVVDIESEGCKICSLSNVVDVRIPYGTKLVNQELEALNIIPRILSNQ